VTLGDIEVIAGKGTSFFIRFQHMHASTDEGGKLQRLQPDGTRANDQHCLALLQLRPLHSVGADAEGFHQGQLLQCQRR